MPSPNTKQQQQNRLTMYSPQCAYLGLLSRSSLVTKEQYSLTVRLETKENRVSYWKRHTNMRKKPRFMSVLTSLQMDKGGKLSCLYKARCFLRCCFSQDCMSHETTTLKYYSVNSCNLCLGQTFIKTHGEHFFNQTIQITNDFWLYHQDRQLCQKWNKIALPIWKSQRKVVKNQTLWQSCFITIGFRSYFSNTVNCYHLNRIFLFKIGPFSPFMWSENRQQCSDRWWMIQSYIKTLCRQ